MRAEHAILEVLTAVDTNIGVYFFSGFRRFSIALLNASAPYDVLAILTKNGRLVQGIGVSFAVVGTTMHILNVVNMVRIPIGHTWSLLLRLQDSF